MEEGGGGALEHAERQRRNEALGVPHAPVRRRCRHAVARVLDTHDLCIEHEVAARECGRAAVEKAVGDGVESRRESTLALRGDKEVVDAKVVVGRVGQVIRRDHLLRRQPRLALTQRRRCKWHRQPTVHEATRGRSAGDKRHRSRAQHSAGGGCSARTVKSCHSIA
jgi:hypothetical protein